MNQYVNSRSGISAYEIGTDRIKVLFKDGWIYVYDYFKTGSQHIETMKQLAQRGQGLNSYINRYVRGRYASKRLAYLKT